MTFLWLEAQVSGVHLKIKSASSREFSRATSAASCWFIRAASLTVSQQSREWASHELCPKIGKIRTLWRQKGSNRATSLQMAMSGCPCRRGVSLFPIQLSTNILNYIWRKMKGLSISLSYTFFAHKVLQSSILIRDVSRVQGTSLVWKNS